MKRGLVLTTLLVTASLAGCLGALDDAADPAQGPANEAERQSLFEEILADHDEHDHTDHAQHEAAYQARLLDHEPIVEDGPSGTHALALNHDEELLFASSTIRGDHGFYVLDVTDPTDMEVLGSYHDDRLVGSDRSIAVSDDAQWVIIGSEGDTLEEEAAVWLFDVSDPTNPQLASSSMLYGGAHTVDTLNIDGTQYVFALNAGVEILRITETPLGTELTKTGKYTIATDTILDNPYTEEDPGEAQTFAHRAAWAHDMKATDDPDEGPLLYVAYAYQGLHVLNLETPEAPQLVSTWTPEGDHTPWYVHSVDVDHIDDRRVIVVGTEVFEDRHVGIPSPLWILDGSDLENPKQLATWTNPTGVGSQHLLFSLHFYRIDDGSLHISHYHGGTWTLDISTQERQEDPEIIAAYLPSEDTGYTPEDDCCLGWDLSGIPMTMDVVGHGPVTFAADLHTGVYAIENTALVG